VRAPELLALRDVDAFYGKSHIVRGASLIVHEHEIVALLGRNGAGKSTLLKTIIGIVPAAAGAIALAGTDVAGRPAAETARRGIGYVPQGRALFAGMSVRHNLELGRLKRRAAPAPPGPRTRSSPSSRDLPSGWIRRPTTCPAGSNRWSRWRGRYRATFACFCSMNRSRAWRRPW
jgi:ABC-type sugar transport system ATPase subunit